MDNRPNPLLVFSAVLYFLAGVAALFAPQELLSFGGAVPSALAVSLLQAVGAAFLGFGMLNWLSRYSRVGGIYGRPIVAANFAHTFAAAALLVKAVPRGDGSPLAWAALGIYGVLAVLFGLKFFGSGLKADRG
ncbi:MAG TPA: hypothetical protein VLQ45_23455 [Thermoanaerobaculia bacterium]|nr:hypothetical protein [Thermoanaerobaculia bacterium]